MSKTIEEKIVELYQLDENRRDDISELKKDIDKMNDRIWELESK